MHIHTLVRKAEATEADLTCLVEKGQSIASQSGAVMRRNCAVCYGWTTSAALSQQETDNEFCALLGHTDPCASGRDVCVYSFVFSVYEISF